MKTLIATPDPEPKRTQWMAVTNATTNTTTTFPATWTLAQVSTHLGRFKPGPAA